MIAFPYSLIPVLPETFLYKVSTRPSVRAEKHIWPAHLQAGLPDQLRSFAVDFNLNSVRWWTGDRKRHVRKKGPIKQNRHLKFKRNFK